MIVVTGEALIDLIPAGADKMRVSVGGGPLNTARWLARLGERVGFLGAISSDMLGRRISAALTASGVSLELIGESTQPTTLAVAQIEADGAARYQFYATGTSAADLHTDWVERCLPRRLTALHFGGLGLELEPTATAVERAVMLAHARGTLVMLDPNVRPSEIREREAYLARLRRLLAVTDLVKLSIDDLGWLTDSEDLPAATRRLIALGPRAVVLTAGQAPASVMTGGLRKPIEIPTPTVDVCDTIGAGDAYGAGLLAYWLRAGLTPDALGNEAEVCNAARFAGCVAAIACAQRGATPPSSLVLPNLGANPSLRTD